LQATVPQPLSAATFSEALHPRYPPRQHVHGGLLPCFVLDKGAEHGSTLTTSMPTAYLATTFTSRFPLHTDHFSTWKSGTRDSHTLSQGLVALQSSSSRPPIALDATRTREVRHDLFRIKSNKELRSCQTPRCNCRSCAWQQVLAHCSCAWYSATHDLLRGRLEGETLAFQACLWSNTAGRDTNYMAL
jgi:hypothetical protein